MGLQYRFEQLAHFGWIASGTDTASFHDFELGIGCVRAAGDQGTCVTHTLSRRRRNTSDKSDNRLLHVVLRPLGSVDLVRTTDFADHDDGVGIGVFVEHLQDVDVLEAVDGIATDTNGGRLTQAQLGQLGNSFVREGARTADDTDATLARDVTGHDADLELVGSNKAWAVRAKQKRLLVLGTHAVAHFEHVANGNSLGNADDQAQVSVDGFPDSSCCTRRRHINDRNRSAGFGLGFLDAAEDGHALEILACLLGMHACDKGFFAIGVFTAVMSVELAGFAGDSLGDDFGVFVDQDRHLQILGKFLFGGSYDFLRSFGHGVGADDGQAGIGQQLLAQLFVGTLHAHHQWNAEVDGLARSNDALGDDVAAHDATEDVDQ